MKDNQEIISEIKRNLLFIDDNCPKEIGLNDCMKDSEDNCSMTCLECWCRALGIYNDILSI